MEKKTIGAFLAVLRKASGMTQQQVADRIGISRSYISRIEKRILARLRRELGRGL